MRCSPPPHTHQETRSYKREEQVLRNVSSAGMLEKRLDHKEFLVFYEALVQFLNFSWFSFAT